MSVNSGMFIDHPGGVYNKHRKVVHPCMYWSFCSGRTEYYHFIMFIHANCFALPLRFSCLTYFSIGNSQSHC